MIRLNLIPDWRWGPSPFSFTIDGVQILAIYAIIRTRIRKRFKVWN